jgi:hypothetical protein
MADFDACWNAFARRLGSGGMALEHELSARALQRRDSLLPALLGAVRARRARARVRRAAVVAACVVSAIATWQLAGPHAPGRRAPDTHTASAWRTLQDDPTILARREVPTRERAEWQLSDDALRRELRAAERPDGLVRVKDRVLVSAAAVDPWPGDSP